MASDAARVPELEGGGHKSFLHTGISSPDWESGEGGLRERGEPRSPLFFSVARVSSVNGVWDGASGEKLYTVIYDIKTVTYDMVHISQTK